MIKFKNASAPRFVLELDQAVLCIWREDFCTVFALGVDRFAANLRGPSMRNEAPAQWVERYDAGFAADRESRLGDHLV